jgi:hypothetical protein
VAELIACIREAWLEVEQDALARLDPFAIEHATIVALLMRQLHERLIELDDDPARQEIAELELALHGTVAELEHERLGDVDEAAA